MKATPATDFCVGISLAHASLALKLDEELGTHHGLGFQDFLLLRCIGAAPSGRVALAGLVRPLGVRLSVLTRLLMPLEKIGLVERETSAVDGVRAVVLRASGRRVLNEALSTAESVCADALHALRDADRAAIAAALAALARAEALAL